MWVSDRPDGPKSDPGMARNPQVDKTVSNETETEDIVDHISDQQAPAPSDD